MKGMREELRWSPESEELCGNDCWTVRIMVSEIVL